MAKLHYSAALGGHSCHMPVELWADQSLRQDHPRHGRLIDGLTDAFSMYPCIRP